MRHICIRAHKHMDTFSFNTASSCIQDDAGLRMNREHCGELIVDREGILRSFLRCYNWHLRQKQESLIKDATNGAPIAIDEFDNDDPDGYLEVVDSEHTKFHAIDV